MRRAATLAVAVAASIGMAGCGGDDSPGSSGAGDAVADPQAAAAYQPVAEALEEAQAPVCPPGEHRSAPPVTGSAAADHFRYLDGRIYELGPCELPLEQRGELRVYRYADTGLRDAAAASSFDRNPRPTFMWTSRDDLLVEQWIFNPAERDPAFAEVSGEVHDAMAGMDDTEGVR